MMSYSDGARLGMCITQVKEDWRHSGKKLIPDNTTEFISDVKFLHAVCLKVEQEITSPLVSPELREKVTSALNFSNAQPALKALNNLSPDVIKANVPAWNSQEGLKLNMIDLNATEVKM